MNKTTKTVLAAIVLSGLLVLLGVGGGLWLSRSVATPGTVASKARAGLAGLYWRIRGRDGTRERTINTARVTLQEKTVYLPADMAEFAGGMSALDGKSLLVLDREGRFFHVDGDIVERLGGLAPPGNGAQALREQLDAGRFGTMTVNFMWFRFNDVLHVRADGRAWLLASYTEWHPDELCATSTLARVEVPAQQPPGQWRVAADDWQVVARTRPCLAPFTPVDATEIIHGLEAGGRLALVGGTTVVWTSGSYERDDRYRDTDFARALAQDEASDYGRVLEVDFLDGRMRHIARGLRNPQGLAIDRSGRIWVADHGMRGGDEVNLVFEGANFGFPAVTYGTHYDGSPAGNRDRHANHEGYDKPLIAFVPSIGTGSLVVAEGFNYAWEGDLIVGGMRAVSLFRVHVEDGRAIYVEPIDIGNRARDMVMLQDGTLAVMTDNKRLLYLRGEEAAGALPVLRQKVMEGVPESERAAVLGAIESCLQCHSVLTAEDGIGPSLLGVCGRKPASTGFAAFSPAIKALGGTWSEDRIASFVARPQQVAPGTTMAWAGADAAIAAHVARTLCR